MPLVPERSLSILPILVGSALMYGLAYHSDINTAEKVVPWGL